MSKNEAQSTETKTRTPSKESTLKLELRSVRRALVKATARGKEFDALMKEMDGHEEAYNTLVSQEANLKTALIAELGLE